MRLLGESAVRRRRRQVGTDRAGGPVYDWAEDTLAVPCALDPGGSREPLEVGRGQVITAPKAYFRDTVDILAGDELVVRGRTWMVQGEPAVWISPFRASVSGTVVDLQASLEKG